MVATWSDSNDSSDDDDVEEVANLCLMALEDNEEEEDNEENEVSDSYTHDELYEAFESLHDEFRKLGIKNVALKKIVCELDKKVDALQHENDSLKKENHRLKDELAKCVSNNNDDLVKENVVLKKKVDWLTNISHKLTQGKEKLDKLLGSQRLSLSKSGLGYDYKNDKKSYHARFVRSHTLFPFSKCNYCGKIGHIS